MTDRTPSPGVSPRTPAVRGLTPRAWWRGLFLEPFRTDGDVHRVAEHVGELVHAEVGALDGEIGREADALGPLGKLGLLAALEHAGDRLGLAVHGHVARHLVAVLH